MMKLGGHGKGYLVKTRLMPLNQQFFILNMKDGPEACALCK